MGLRERKKAQTRQRIAETARRLFGERGFAGVTVAEVAREAEVAEATLFNYFPTKEDLFYSGLEVFGAQLVDAVRQRPADASVLEAFRSFLLADTGQLGRIAEGDQDALERARTTARIITSSPSLQARERQILLGIAGELADAVAADPLSQAVAYALMGVHISLLDHVRGRLLDGDRAETIAADVQERAAEALGLLERGLRDYGRGG